MGTSNRGGKESGLEGMLLGHFCSSKVQLAHVQWLLNVHVHVHVYVYDAAM